MKREWQPGDVAMVRQLYGTERLAIVGTYGRPAALGPPHYVPVNRHTPIRYVDLRHEEDR